MYTYIYIIYSTVDIHGVCLKISGTQTLMKWRINKSVYA